MPLIPIVTWWSMLQWDPTIRLDQYVQCQYTHAGLLVRTLHAHAQYIRRTNSTILDLWNRNSGIWRVLASWWPPGERGRIPQHLEKTPPFNDLVYTVLRSKCKFVLQRKSTLDTSTQRVNLSLTEAKGRKHSTLPWFRTFRFWFSFFHVIESIVTSSKAFSLPIRPFTLWWWLSSGTQWLSLKSFMLQTTHRACLSTG
jgi:hypothetical protein